MLHCEVIWSRQSSKDALPEAGKTSSGLRMVPVWSSNDTPNKHFREAMKEHRFQSEALPSNLAGQSIWSEARF